MPRPACSGAPDADVTALRCCHRLLLGGSSPDPRCGGLLLVSGYWEQHPLSELEEAGLPMLFPMLRHS